MTQAGVTTRSMDAMHEDTKPQCEQCGYKHRPKECPAFGQQCSICHKLHHFAKVCRNKRLTVSKNRQTINSKASAKKESLCS